MLKEAEGRARECRFAEAAALLQSALHPGIPPGDESALSARGRAMQTHARLCANIPEAAVVDISAMGRVHFTTGGMLDGEVRREGDRVRIRRPSGISTSVAKDEIERIDPIPVEEVRKGIQADLDRLGGSSGSPGALTLLEMGLTCYRHGWKERVGEFLDRALAADPRLEESIRDVEARELYEMVRWFRSKRNEPKAREFIERLRREHPDSRYLDPLSGSSRPAPPPATGAAATPPVPGSLPRTPASDAPVAAGPESAGGERVGAEGSTPEPPAPDPFASFTDAETRRLVGEAERKYQEGLDALSHSYGREASANDACLRALGAFRKAVELFEEAQSREPESAWLEERLREAREQRVHCFLRAR